MMRNEFLSMEKLALRIPRGAAVVMSALLIAGAVVSPAPASAAENPNPSRITEASWWLMEELLKLDPGTQNGGIYANKPGYHNTRAANDPSDYSVRDAEDQAGPSDKAAAYDWTFPEAQSLALAAGETGAEPDLLLPSGLQATTSDYSNIARYSSRLLASGKDPSDPRLDGWREFYGQADTDSSVEGWDFRYDTAVSSDSSHLWHIHLSEDRGKVSSYENKEALLSVLRGETVEQWLSRGASYALSGDWFRTGEFTPAVVQRSGSVWEWNIKRSQSGGAADVKFTYGDADMVPVAGDWDGDGDWTPGVVANESNSRRWYLKNSLAGGVSDVNFLYGGKDYIPVAGDWDGNGTFTPGVVSRDNGAWKWELRNANSGGAVSATLRYGNSNTWPVAGDWDGNLTWTPAVVDDTDGPRRWFLKNDLGTDGLADVQFNYGSHGTYPVPGNWNGATAATEPGIVENFESRVWRWYLKNSVSGGTADEYFDYGNDAPYPYTF